jgi:CheY-like chemotaxis protein
MNMVRIYFVGTGPVMRATEQVTVTLLDKVEIVTTLAEAHIVVAENFHGIEESYDEDKHYVIVSSTLNAKTPSVENVTVFRPGFELGGYCSLIAEVLKGLGDQETTEEAIPEVDLLPDAKRILVIDDTSANLVSAKKSLTGHHLTVADGYSSAMALLAEQEFDVVLTDLYMPMVSQTLSEKAFELGKLVPYGFILMYEAARRGAKFVAIVTDLGHHDDHFSAAFDHFQGVSLTIESAKTMMLHARLTEDGTKDWNRSLETLLQD